MAEILRLGKVERPPERSWYVPTDTGEDIARSLDMMQHLDGGAVTMIAGAPGVGKTRALGQFCKQAQAGDTVYCAIARGEGRPTNVAEVILRAWRVRTNGMSLPKMRETVVQYVNGRTLILDEAQYLDKEGVEWARAAAEEGGFNLVLCGDLALADLVNGIPQLQSRLFRPVIIGAVKRSDAAAIAADAGVTDPASVDQLCAVARLKGGLRNVDNVLRLATMFAGGDLPPLAAIKAAVMDMKLNRAGDE
jgi:DNA transposition AAA+ family ATPase